MVEQIIIVVPQELQEKLLPLIKEEYGENVKIVNSSKDLETEYIEIMEFEKRPTLPDSSVLYQTFLEREQKYKKQQEKFSLKYQNKHFKNRKK